MTFPSIYQNRMSEEHNNAIVKKNELTHPIKPRLAFFKLDVGSKESLKFFEALFTFLKFQISYKDDQQIHFSNGETGIVVYHGFNVTGSGIYVLDTGINALFFRVESREEVDRFYDEFLKVRRIPITTSDNKYIREEEGRYSIFFRTAERITIGIICE